MAARPGNRRVYSPGTRVWRPAPPFDFPARVSVIRCDVPTLLVGFKTADYVTGDLTLGGFSIQRFICGTTS